LVDAMGGKGALEAISNRRRGSGRGRYPPQKGQRNVPT
jgi:hypothetical protein